VARQTAEEIVSAAWDAVVRHVDTAPFYGVGQPERCVGDALRERPRDEWVLSTKVGRLLRPNPTGMHPDGRHHPLPFDPVYDYSYDGIMRSFEAARVFRSASAQRYRDGSLRRFALLGA
jgi:D-threo-aldose 1-dehydrogenase